MCHWIQNADKQNNKQFIRVTNNDKQWQTKWKTIIWQTVTNSDKQNEKSWQTITNKMKNDDKCYMDLNMKLSMSELIRNNFHVQKLKLFNRRVRFNVYWIVFSICFDAKHNKLMNYQNTKWHFPFNCMRIYHRNHSTGIKMWC